MNTFFNFYESLWHQNNLISQNLHSTTLYVRPGIHHIKYSTLTIVVVNHIYKEGVTDINSNTDFSYSHWFILASQLLNHYFIWLNHKIFISFCIFLNSNLNWIFYAFSFWIMYSVYGTWVSYVEEEGCKDLLKQTYRHISRKLLFCNSHSHENHHIQIV